jgi:hypothetical protein
MTIEIIDYVFAAPEDQQSIGYPGPLERLLDEWNIVYPVFGQ